MTSTDPESVPPDLPIDAPSEGPPPSPPVSVGPAWSSRSLWGWALAAGLLAGLVSWLGGERIYMIFDLPPEPTPGMSPPPEVTARINRVRMAVRMREGAATFGLLGAASGMALGLAGGMVRRNLRAALVAAGAGLVLGGASGAVAGLGLVRVFHQNADPLSGDLILPMLVHGAIGTAIGLAAGLAFGIGLGGRGRIVRAALGGVLGAIAGTIVYELAGALAFPLANTQLPISPSVATRLFAHLAVAFFIAAGAASAVREPGAKAASR